MSAGGGGPGIGVYCPIPHMAAAGGGPDGPSVILARRGAGSRVPPFASTIRTFAEESLSTRCEQCLRDGGRKGKKTG